jgi:hypothetical protein
VSTKTRWHRSVLPLLIVFLVVLGCGKKDGSKKNGVGSMPVSAEDLAAVKTAMTRGMQPLGYGSVKSSQIGKVCVVEARTPDEGLKMVPPPPPPGMIRIVGQVTFYRGELDTITPDSLTVRKAYPTAGNFKKIEIPKGDIRSIYLAP